MINGIFRYGTLFVITVIVLSILSFSLAYVFPGDALVNFSGVTPASTGERLAIAQKWAMDEPVLMQLITYWQLLVQGEWGVSSVSGLSLLDEIRSSIPATIELSIYAIVIAVFVGVPSGCIAGYYAYSKVDYTLNAAAVVQYSIPVFWLALAMIMLFCLQLNWLPVSGRLSLLYDVPARSGFVLIDILLADNINRSDAFSNAISHLIIPSLALGVVTGSALTRLYRRAVIDTLNQPFIAAARSRGLSEATIFFQHVLRNATLSVLPSIALLITTLITNAMIIETLFSWPGIGNWLLGAIYKQDYTAVRIGMFVVASLIIALTILVDLINRIIDPRKGRTGYAAT